MRSLDVDIFIKYIDWRLADYNYIVTKTNGYGVTNAESEIINELLRIRELLTETERVVQFMDEDIQKKKSYVELSSNKKKSFWSKVGFKN